MPVTISGVSNDRYREVVSQGVRRFHSAYAARVPMTVESAVAERATTKELAVASISWRLWKTSAYQCQVKPCQTANFDELKLNNASTSSGTYKKPKIMAA